MADRVMCHFPFFLNHLRVSFASYSRLYFICNSYKTPVLWCPRFQIHESAMLEISSLIVKSCSWQEGRPFCFYSKQNWQNISIRLRWMAYFHWVLIQPLRSMEWLNSGFILTGRVSLFLSFCLSFFSLSPSSSVKSPDALPSQRDPYKSPHSGPPRPLVSDLCCRFVRTFVPLCVFASKQA